MPRLEGCPTRDKIDEAITAIDTKRSDHALLAYWTDFGSIPYEQLHLVRRILIAGNAFREAKLTIEWVERAAWKEKYICPPFQDLRWIPKDTILVSVRELNLGHSLLENDLVHGAQLLSIRGQMWLNTTVVLTVLLYLKRAFPRVGNINPSYHESVDEEEDCWWIWRIQHQQFCCGRSC
ncbi:hypothetical protein PI124_g5470 [Phytophthora idaei]|nr:hypothetical protein PI124_g5470 [Phytophthora idaei]